MSPGGLAKPTTILLQQQDAGCVGDVSPICSFRQKNAMKNNTPEYYNFVYPGGLAKPMAGR